MKLPRDLNGGELAERLGVLGYANVRQVGSHLYLTTQTRGEHHVCIPNHRPLRIGTLNGILKSVAAHHGISRQELLEML